MKKALNIGALSLALLFGTTLNCDSPKKIDENKRKTLEQAIEQERYDSSFLDSRQLNALLENNTRTYTLREPSDSIPNFEKIKDDYKIKWGVGITIYNRDEIGEFSYEKIPNLIDYIPEEVKRKAIEDSLFSYGKAIFSLDRFRDDTLRFTPYNKLFKLEFNAYDKNLKKRPDLEEKYRPDIIPAIIEVLRNSEVVGEDYKEAVLVQLPFSFGINTINDEKKNQ